MSIRWRLSIVFFQLVVLAAATVVVEGRPYTGSTWFFAGLLALVINTQLLEPFFPRPVDALANSLLALVLYLTAEKEVARAGWYAVAVILLVILVAALTALLLGAGRKEGPLVRLARSARVLAQAANARFIYSLIFFASILESFPPTSDEFWTLAIAWVVIVIAGSVNWQAVWSTAAGGPIQTRVEGLVGPSRLLVTGLGLPTSGVAVSLGGRTTETEGVVVTRILRPHDTWAEIHISDPAAAQRLLSGGAVTVSIIEPPDNVSVIGSVDEGSTHEQLIFTAASPLSIGTAVTVDRQGQANPILYQLSGAEVTESRVKGGSHLIVRATADQIGVFDPEALRLVQHRWVPDPGGPVAEYKGGGEEPAKAPDTWLLLGHVLGTAVPVYLDLEELVAGHLAILGMTKMGKTTLAIRIAEALGVSRRVVMLDQTGEYFGKRHVPLYDKEMPWNQPGFSVLNLPKDDVGPDFALAFVKKIGQLAADEYEAGDPHPRSIMFDEAHQFMPEPAGLGFGSPGRDSSYELGVHFMQLRKYGISLVLISQRTAVVAKSGLSQCENLIIFRSVDRTGLDYLEQIAGQRVSRILPTLSQGEALILGPAISSDFPVVISVSIG